MRPCTSRFQVSVISQMSENFNSFFFFMYILQIEVLSAISSRIKDQSALSFTSQDLCARNFEYFARSQICKLELLQNLRFHCGETENMSEGGLVVVPAWHNMNLPPGGV